MAPAFLLWLTISAPITPEMIHAAEQVDQLGHPSFRVRERAERELARLAKVKGSPVPSLLRAARTHPNAEVRARVAVLVGRIDEDAFLQPSRVTLNLDHVPIKNVLKQLSRQTGNPIVLQSGGTESLVNLSMKDVTFWQAFDRLALETGGTIASFSEPQPTLIFYVGQEVYSPHVHLAGPFRLSLSAIQSQRAVMLDSRPRDGRPEEPNPEIIQIEMKLLVEPRFKVLNVGTGIVKEARDEAGRSLVPPPVPEEERHIAFFRESYQEPQCEFWTAMTLHRPVRTARVIKRLTGEVPVTLVREVHQDIVITNLSQFTQGTFKGKSVTIDAKRRKSDDGEFLLELKFGGSNQGPFWSIDRFLSSRLKAFDSDGKPFQIQTQYGLFLEEQDYTIVALTAPKGEKRGPPERLVIERWDEVERSIKFEFRDVPLP